MRLIDRLRSGHILGFCAVSGGYVKFDRRVGGEAIKESLVLLCEVRETVGDRYGVYGFSGMRRSRCDLFHIKHMDEPCTEQVRQRIGTVGPKEYTRMGPPLRHLTKILKKTDARVSLLITLSDGKTEDYDDYKGEYAV